MRIHSDTLTGADVDVAARIARVDYGRFAIKGSRSRARAFDVTLTGESRHRPNNRGAHGGYDFAATWDQWGVFLAVLFDRDPAMLTPYYADAASFHYQTAYRFDFDRDEENWWPTDAHGDHVFRFAGVPFEQKCTRCTAVRRWQ